MIFLHVSSAQVETVGHGHLSFVSAYGAAHDLLLRSHTDKSFALAALEPRGGSAVRTTGVGAGVVDIAAHLVTVEAFSFGRTFANLECPVEFIFFPNPADCDAEWQSALLAGGYDHHIISLRMFHMLCNGSRVKYMHPPVVRNIGSRKFVLLSAS